MESCETINIEDLIEFLKLNIRKSYEHLPYLLNESDKIFETGRRVAYREIINYLKENKNENN